MQKEELKQLALRLIDDQLSPDEFLRAAQQQLTANLDTASVDLDRGRRCGFPEVIYGTGKTVDSLREIIQRLCEAKSPILATRITREQARLLADDFPAARYNSIAQTLRIDVSADMDDPKAASQAGDHSRRQGRVAVVTAGTSDQPVAEEAYETLDWMKVAVTTVRDVGVAGPQRLHQHVQSLREMDAIVVVAGMEGALPSVVAGHVPCPVIAVPTSVGYGANLGGFAALLAMLNSCAANVTVVNIDAGFKGGFVAGLIASRAATAGKS